VYIFSHKKSYSAQSKSQLKFNFFIYDRSTTNV